MSASVVNGKIYAIGGSDGHWLNNMEKYDPATDTWTTKAAMPTELGGIATAVHNNKIYVIRGWGYSPHNITGKNEAYNQSTDTGKQNSDAHRQN